jgi:hypothetical protein
VLISDIYYHFIESRLQSKSENWENTSDDRRFKAPDHATSDEDKENEKSWTELQRNAHKSFEDCSKACEEDHECFQFKHTSGSESECALSHSVRLGSPQKLDANPKIKSGWHLERIKELTRKNGKCTNPEWI